ncbi:MAG: nucleoside triphosphate pyrophosphohydrolase [Oscillospiraceae bacterium]|nr:nucleoside triphosphate pyrophosphohydrolase [Oscillospiraceae bacterium]
MVDFENKPTYDIYDLKRLMALLRGPGGCPWDAEQTHGSIKRNLLEEAYEAAEAIDEDDTEHLLEELGDVLMQVVFHADMAEKEGRFDLDRIADATCKKLIRRHPHVFGDVKAANGAESLLFWDDIKRGEKKQETAAEAMAAVARNLPALWRAEKIQKKAAKAGFDWPDHTGALEALRSEIDELEHAISIGEGVSGELGDLLFSAVNVARFFDINPEEALGAAGDKFISRFAWVEKAAVASGRQLEGMKLEEMEELYQQAKLEE